LGRNKTAQRVIEGKEGRREGGKEGRKEGRREGGKEGRRGEEVFQSLVFR